MLTYDMSSSTCFTLQFTIIYLHLQKKFLLTVHLFQSFLCEFIKKNFIISASSFKINLTYLELKTWQLLSIKCIHLA